jgi:hypothetical protein
LDGADQFSALRLGYAEVAQSGVELSTECREQDRAEYGDAEGGAHLP